LIVYPISNQCGLYVKSKLTEVQAKPYD